MRALSSAYVERRHKLAEGAALDGAGKRAAFALFYGPIHFLLVHEILRAIPRTEAGDTIVDLGCGTGAAGAAWAATSERPPRVVGIDRHPWAVAEAAWTYRQFGLKARVERADVTTAQWPKGPVSIVAAYSANEIVAEAARDALWRQLIDRTRRGDRLLVVEPLARFVAPWWVRWRGVVIAAGGREDEWRFRVELPAIVSKLDKAAGLDHHELTGRSLWVG